MISDGGGDSGRRGDAPVRIYLPDAALLPFVTFYYFVEPAGPLDDFLYPEWANVRFSLRGDWSVRMGDRYPPGPLITPLFGSTDRAAEIVSNGGMIAGFGLTPLGWDRYLDMPASALANRICDVGDLFGTPGEEVRQALIGHSADTEGVALFDALLLDRLATREPNDPVALTIDEVLRGRPHSVTDFADAAGLPERTLHRACLKLFGFAPKRLLRRQRFLDTLGQIRITDKPSFGSLLDADYCDQAHFNREFREFMGLTPREYLRVPRPLMRDAAMAQVAAGITLSFKLPPQPGSHSD